MKPIIKVEGLGKQYRVGALAQKFPTLRDSLANAVRKPLDMLRANGHTELFWALRDLEFDVAPGEVIGIIGRNGAGKSTLLKILSRITEPTTGRVELYGRVASLLEVGTGFHPELTGRENVFLNGAILGMRKAEIERKFDEIVAFAEIEKFLDTQVKRYSSGMYVRLAFAVAAHLEPEILIVDEVLAVGDAEFQKKCLGKMQEVSQRGGRTVLFVSHNMTAVRSLCSCGIVLKDGSLSFNGSAHDAVENYLGTTSLVPNCGWSRDPAAPRANLSIESIAVALKGDQPNHQLQVDVGLASHSAHPPAFIAVDFFDLFGGWLMQAIPTV